MGRFFWRIAAWLTGGLLLLALVGAVAVRYYTRTPEFLAQLRERILVLANEALDAELHFSRITGSIWGDLEFHDVSIVQDDVRVIGAPTVVVDVGLMGQLYTLIRASTLRLARIEILRPELNLIEDPQRGWNIGQLVKENGAEEPRRLTVELNQVNVTGGIVTLAPADADRVELSSVDAAASVRFSPTSLNATLKRVAFVLDWRDLPSTTWNAAARFEQLDERTRLSIERLAVTTEHSRAVLDGTVQNLRDPELDLRLQIAKASARELNDLLPALRLRQDFTAEARVTGGLSALDITIALAAKSGRLRSAGVADLTGPRPRVKGELEFEEFEAGEVLAFDQFRGTANGRVTFEGDSLEQVNAAGRGRISGLGFRDWNLGQVSLTAELNNRSLNFSARSERNGTAEIQGTANLGPQPDYRVTLTARSLQVARLAAKSHELPETTLSFDAWARGAGTDPRTMRLESGLVLQASRVGGVPIESGSVEISASAGKWTLRHLRVTGRGATLIADGSLGFRSRPNPVSLTYSLKLGRLSPWLQLAGLEGDGRGRIEGTVAGSLQAPRFDGRASMEELRLAGAEVGRGEANWKIIGSHVGDWSGRAEILTRDIKGLVPLQSVRGRFVLESIRPIALGADILAREIGGSEHRAGGRLSYANERVEVSLHTLTFQLPNGSWRNRGMVHLVITPPAVTIRSFELVRNGQRLTLSGMAGWEGPQQFGFTIAGLPLSDIRPYLPEGAPELAGNLTASGRVEGTATRPSIESQLTISGLQIAGQAYAGFRAKALYSDERLDLDATLLQDGAHRLSVTGNVPVYLGWGDRRSRFPQGAINLRVHSPGLHPAFLRALSREVEKLDGTISMDVVIGGTLRAPAPRGWVRFQDGGAVVRPLGITLAAIDFRANVAPGAIEIVGFSARSSTGRLNASGTAATSGLEIVRLALSAELDRFQFINTREYTGIASGRLLAEGDLDQLSVRGALTVQGKARPELAFLRRAGAADQDPTIVVFRNDSERAAAARADVSVPKPNGTASPQRGPFFRGLAVNIDVTVSRGTWVYLDEGSVEITGKLNLLKARNDDLALSGAIRGVRGSYTFHGRTFRIEDAVVTFTGGKQIDPLLNVVGLHRAPRYVIELIVGGSASKPTLALRSDPPLEQADILAVLLFGRPVQALTRGEQATLQTQALQASANFIASDLTQSVARMLGLDALSFGVREGMGAGQLEVGTYISENVFVSSTQELGGAREQEYSIEYNITPNWQLKSSASPTGESGIDLFWRKRY